MAATIIAILLALITACSSLPVLPAEQAPATAPPQAQHIRKIKTPPYVGNRGAIILTITQAGDLTLKDAVDSAIRAAADNRLPVDIALSPLQDSGNYKYFTSLRDFVDAGAINICFDGNSIVWLDADTPKQSTAYSNLKNNLVKYREEFHIFFGSAPASCILPSQYFNEINYTLLKDAGFKVLTATGLPEINSFREAVTWEGNTDRNGLFRLPIVALLDYSLPLPKKNKLNPSQKTAALNAVDRHVLDSVDRSLFQWGIAVVEILPGTLLDNDGKVDSIKLSQLTALIRQLGRKGDVTTADDWYSYISRWSETASGGSRVLPPYNGGRAIIFRLDDVALGWHEDVVRELLILFEKNGIPIDLGIVSNIDETDSYAMPWLKDYVNRGVAGISVHGYDWDFYELDTAQSKADYADIKFKLRKARDSYSQYFGVNPVALTVPTDSWDKTGYRAVQDSGFKIFSTHITEDPTPSIDLVDAYGRKDPAGMYRLPSSSDVCEWDEVQSKWGNVIDISKIAKIDDYCKYYQAYEDQYYNEIGTTTCSLLNYIGVAAITIHPDAFVTASGTVDKEKLAQIQPILNWAKSQATVTTFEQWYNHRIKNK